MTPLSTAPRWLAALRCEPLPCGHWNHRDPLLCRTAPTGPSTYSLDDDQLTAEAARCRADGWQPWEVAERLAVPA